MSGCSLPSYAAFASGAAGASGAGGAVAMGGPSGAGGAVAMGGTIGSSGAPAGASGAPATSGSGGADDCSSDCQTQALKAVLAHRYSFDGTGTSVPDGAGSAPGTVVNAALGGDGTLTFPGGTTDAYVDLPNGIVSSLTDATFEAWLTWNGGDPWQRIFDFGSTTTGENTQGEGVTYLFLVPLEAEGYLRASYSISGIPGETFVQATPSLPVGREVQIDLVVDDTNDSMSLYLDGQFSSSVAFGGHLAALRDYNNWLGRSQYIDAPLSAVFDEFRIYSAALTAKQIALSHSSGPNPAFLP